MLEIVAIINLGKSITKIIREKGRKPFKYVLLMVFMWIGFEITGAVIANLFFGGGFIAYPIALAGAALGGYLSYSIAKNASPIESPID